MLVLRDVLGFRAAEVADMLDTSQAAVTGALQRARATLRTRLPAGSRERVPLPSSARERELVGRFAAAVEAGDIDAIVSLLTEDALGHDAAPAATSTRATPRSRAFLRDRARSARRSRVPTRGDPGERPAGVRLLPARTRRPQSRTLTGCMVLTLEGDRIAAITWFADNSRLSALRAPAHAAGLSGDAAGGLEG